MEWTFDQIKRLRKPGRYGIGGGLYVVVSPGGTKSWVQRIQADGKRVDKGLGGIPAVSLSAARKRADANRVLVRSGDNPWATKPRASGKEVKTVAKVYGEEARLVARNAPSFQEVARNYYQRHRPTWKSERHARTWLGSLEKHVFPKLAHVPVNEVTRPHVLAVLEPLWPEQPESARRIRARMRAVFKFAIACEHIESNPAGDDLDGAMMKAARLRNHHRALHYRDVPAAWETLTRLRGPEDFQPHGMSLVAIRFLILTAARAGEVRGATYHEFDLETGLWTIPASRMKAGVEHRVPLSSAALEITTWRLAHKWPDGYGDLMFPGANGMGRPMGENVLWQLCRADGLACSPHGFRSSFRDWAAERTNYSREAIEMSLAHAVGGAVERAYFRSDLLDQRRELMQAWADYVAPRGA